jgi:carbon storage regulator
LVLSRKLGEKVYVGSDITITLLEVMGSRIRIGIEAPPHIRVLRAELDSTQPIRADANDGSLCRTPFNCRSL